MNAKQQSDCDVQVLRIAADAVGNTDELARRLRVDPAQLAGWLLGDAAPPLETLMDALDIITDRPWSTPDDVMSQPPDLSDGIDPGLRATMSSARR